MNIDKIVKERPKAWEEWLRFVELDINNIFKASFQNNSIWITTKGHKTHFSYFRTLYDYFDSVGIVISVYYDVDAGWCYEVVYDNECDGERWYESRQDVEFEAIPKAFEIREQQLNNSK